MPGYSGTPLAKKLGITGNSRVVCTHAPAEYLNWLAPLPANVVFADRVDADTDVAHVFESSRAALSKSLKSLRAKLRDDATLWVSWPKKASKVPTDITEDTIRELALPLGLVDVKVCAVSEVWSGLKLVLRKELRQGKSASIAAARAGGKTPTVITPLFKKLNLGTQTSILVLDAPESFEAELAALQGIQIKRALSGTSAFAMAFVRTQSAVDSASRRLTQACSGDAVLWMVYPKASSKRYTCDFNRDSGWAALNATGFEPVRIVAIDADWSALRFRRVEFIKSRSRGLTP